MNALQQSLNSSIAHHLKTDSASDGVCLTITFVAEGGGRNYHTHSKHLRNIVGDLQKHLGEAVLTEETASALRREGEALAERKEAWAGDYEGVCIHIGEQGGHLHRLTNQPKDSVTVGDRFKFIPMADALYSSSPLLVLSLSFKYPQLFRYDGQKAELFGEVELPESVYDFSEAEVVDPGQRAHVRRSNGGNPQLSTHSMAHDENPRDLNQEVYIREICHALGEVEETKELPMLVLGDENIVPKFRAAYHHPQGHTFEKMDVQSHPKAADVEGICRTYLNDVNESRIADIVSKIKDANPSSELYTDNLKDVYQAAVTGRIATCIISADASAWLKSGESEGIYHSSKPGEEGAFDALEGIFREVIDKDGEVAVVASEHVPNEKPTVALLRW